MLLHPSVVQDPIPTSSNNPLEVNEVITFLRNRWQATFDFQLVVRKDRLYLQMMWAYLEQQSFPLTEKEYRTHLAQILDVVNRLGLAAEVREWLATTPKKPRLGRAVSFPLKGDGCLEEFVL